MLTGAGIIASFDERTLNSTSKGHLGGILQSANYIAGVSGGSWLVSSLALYNCKPVTSISQYWNINEPLLEGVPNFDVSRSVVSETEKDELQKIIKRDLQDTSLINLVKQVLSRDDKEKGGLQMKDILDYYKNLHLDVRPKKKMGFHLSFTDYWGRAIAKRIFPVFTKSPGVTISDITKLGSFKNFQQPFPILVSNAQYPGLEFDHLNSQIFEFNPYEFGSWDDHLAHFVKVKFLGSQLYNGSCQNVKNRRHYCIRNFDNLGFITGTSSSLFNNVIIYIWQVALASKKETYNAIKTILTAFGLNLDKLDNSQEVIHSDYALYSPNPFNGLSSKLYLENVVNSSNLFLADGGEDGENIPFQPLIQKHRNIDIIFAVDSTSDLNNWPNGTTINLTSDRYNSGKSIYGFHGNTRYSFPLVPNPKEMIDKKLYRRPMFLGCYLESYSETPEYSPPLIVYLPNSEQSFKSNTSTFKLTYNDLEKQQMIENGYNIATFQNSTIDKYYSQCVGCAILKRDFDRKSLRQNFKIPRFCDKCYKKYCYN